MRTRTLTGRESLTGALVALLLAATMILAHAPAPHGGALETGIGAAPSIDALVPTALRDGGSAEVVVQVQPGAEAAAVAAVEGHGGEVTAELPIVHGFAASITQAGLEALRLLGDSVVRAVTLDTPIRFGKASGDWGERSDTFFPRKVGATKLQDQGYDGSGVGIAVIDTGVNEIADLDGRVVGGIDLSSEQDGVDRYGHGTFVAAIAAGDGSSSDGEVAGVAPGAHVVPVKMAGANGAADVSHILAALQWVVSHADTYDIGVVNMSFGTDSLQPQVLDPLNYAVQRAWNEGIVVIVSAANDGPSAKTIMKPADDPFVITVGATDSRGTVGRGNDIVPDFSSRGPTRADGFEKPDIVAPGTRIVSARVPGSTLDQAHPQARVGEHHMRASGTSFSAAVVSGAVALLRQANPGWTPDQIKGALIESAAPGPVGDHNVDGYGALDIAAAAALDDPPVANQDAQPGTGLGTLEDSRGTLEIEIQKDLISSLLGGIVTILLDDERTAQDRVFDTTEYVTEEWTAETWLDSQWYGSHWYGSHWYGSHWYGSHWYGSHWYGAEWE